MKNFNWNLFKAKLIAKGITVKQWCVINGIDLDRYRNIRNNRVKPNDLEINLFNQEVSNG